MELQVLKFGGTSVGSLKRIEAVADLLVERSKHAKIVAVLSAMAGETDKLVEMARYFSAEPNQREYDMLLSTGEQRSIALMSICLQARGVKARSLLADQIGFITDEAHTKARIKEIRIEKIKACLDQGEIVIAPGFQGVSVHNEITTLGRGGSDTSAVAIAAALKADRCEIYTDVEGVYTTDPNIVAEAQKLNFISYDEMLELASLGAKVLQTRSVEFAKKYNIPIHVRSSFKKTEGTWVVKESDKVEDLVVSGIAYTKNEAQITLEGMPANDQISAELFGALGDANISVDVIIQEKNNQGEVSISFTCLRDDVVQVMKLIEEKKLLLNYKNATANRSISKVSVVGNGMRSHSGVAGRVFRVFAKEKIEILSISTSEIKISCVVDESYSKAAVQALHAEFELDQLQRT